MMASRHSVPPAVLFSKWKGKTFWPVLIFAGFAGLYSLFDIYEKFTEKTEYVSQKIFIEEIDNLKYQKQNDGLKNELYETEMLIGVFQNETSKQINLYVQVNLLSLPTIKPFLG